MKPARAVFAYMFLISMAACQPVRTVKVTVIGDDQKPVEGANVVVWYYGYLPEHTKEVEGLTDEEGVFEAKGQPLLGILSRVNKEGYYETESEDLNKREDHDITLVLREKKNPIPLYAKNEVLRFPANREWIGYDFEVGDWTDPYGRGHVADVLFMCDTETADLEDGKGILQIKFKEDEGIVISKENYLNSSAMKMPHEAPLKGYVNSFVREEGSFRNEERTKNTGYFFRTRVSKNESEILSARYGKIIRDISFYPVHTKFRKKGGDLVNSYATVKFTYYFNPAPNDRNLEFDPSRNLLKNLDLKEQVREP